MPSPSDRDLQELTDEVRRADAVESRRREMWLRRQAEEEGTFHGMLIDLTERQGAMAVRTVGGPVVRGRVATLGADFVAVTGAGGGTTLVPLSVVTAVSPEPGTTPTVGDRPESTTATFAVTVAELVADRPSVTVHTVGGDRLAGALWTVGQDLLVVRADPTADTYVPFTAVNDLTWR
jgi:hypothetical protein